MFFIHPPVNEHLGCSQSLAVVSKAAISMGMQISFRCSVLNS